MRRHIRTSSRLVLAIGLLLSMVENSQAVPARPGIAPLLQADGAKILARQWGDEWMHGMETQEGYSIVLDEATRNWVYAVANPAGELVPSKSVVGVDPPPDGVTPHLRPSGQASSRIDAVRDSAIGPTVVPPTGTGQIPILMINFNNTSTTYIAADFNTALFGATGKTMSTFYKEVSYNIFNVAGTVVGWYTAANTHDYYGTNWPSGSCQGSDKYPATLVREAVVAADSAVNFATYDTDGDGYVDNVMVIHQGTGEEDYAPCRSATDIWSHSWDLYSASVLCGDGAGTYTTNDPWPGHSGQYIKVSKYTIQPEVVVTTAGCAKARETIGVFCHEFGHALGLPDLYDTNGGSEGIGDWCLMAGGSWDYTSTPGDTPSHPSAWCKYRLGWVTPTAVVGTLTGESIQSAATAPDVYRLRTGSPSLPTSQYFLVENRHKTGFDAGLPGSGLAIWHIDENKANNQEQCAPPSDCSSAHYKVSLEQADGLWDLEKAANRGNAGDLYTSTSQNTPLSNTFTDASTPSSKLYIGSRSGASVTSISAAGATMTATLYQEPTSVDLTSFTATSSSATSILVEWKTASEAANEGFDLFRSASAAGPWVKLNASLIPGAGTSFEPHVYTWPDEGLSNGTYFYRLEDVSTQGVATSHGPVEAVLGPHCGAVPAASGGSPLTPLLVSMGLLLALRRRSGRGARLTS